MEFATRGPSCRCARGPRPRRETQPCLSTYYASVTSKRVGNYCRKRLYGILTREDDHSAFTQDVCRGSSSQLGLAIMSRSRGVNVPGGVIMSRFTRLLLVLAA